VFWTTRSPDIWLIFGGSINDSFYTSAQIQAAVVALYAAIRMGSSAPIIQFGTWPAFSKGTEVARIEAATKAGFDQAADRNSFWLPINGASPFPWVTHSFNNSGMPSGASNLSLMLGGDQTHPTDLGIRQVLVPRAAQAIRQLVLPFLK
jgi:hypothetical protein